MSRSCITLPEWLSNIRCAVRKAYPKNCTVALSAMLADGLGQGTSVPFGLPYCAVYLSAIIAVTLLACA